MSERLRKLVVYYSFDGNTKFVAETMAKTIGADLLELKPKNEMKSHGFLKIFRGGRQVFKKEKPELLPFDKRPEDYDLIFIGTPVWAFNYAPALATFFSKVRLTGKKIALFCCAGGFRGNTLENMKDKLVGNQIVGEIDFVEPLKHNKVLNAEKARRWAMLVE